jgi:hypothetical protein
MCPLSTPNLSLMVSFGDGLTQHFPHELSRFLDAPFSNSLAASVVSPPMSARIAMASLAAGVCWGGIAWLLGVRAFGPELYAGVAAAPFIGVAVGLATQRLFARTTGWRRGLTALVSLYLGAVLFAIPMGIAASLMRGRWTTTLSHLAAAETSVLWGVTMTGYFIVLWPLAWLTHHGVEWSVDR